MKSVNKYLEFVYFIILYYVCNPPVLSSGFAQFTKTCSCHSVHNNCQKVQNTIVGYVILINNN